MLCEDFLSPGSLRVRLNVTVHGKRPYIPVLNLNLTLTLNLNPKCGEYTVGLVGTGLRVRVRLRVRLRAT